MWNIGLIKANEVCKIAKIASGKCMGSYPCSVVCHSHTFVWDAMLNTRWQSILWRHVLYSFIVSSYRLPGSSTRMVPLVRKNSGGDTVKPSGGKLHTSRSREDRHQKGTSRLMVKRENTDLRHGVQGEQLPLFIVFTTEKVWWLLWR